MNSSQWQHARELFERAIEQGRVDSDAWLREQSSGDEAVEAEVRSLLRHHAGAGEFLNKPYSAGTLGFEGRVLQSGERVGAYEIIRELGRGGMGRVYLAIDRRLHRQVALKALLPQLTGSATSRARLEREAQAAAQLKHPGICTVYALEEIDGELFIAAEYVQGRTMRDEITSGARPSASAVAETARELAGAIGEAHRNGIVHRDLKPENIVRTREGRLKILDFGLARIEEAVVGERPFVTYPGLAIGTPAYMAPEQLTGEAVDARADIWALGVLLYEYAAGVHPFEAKMPLAEAPPLANRWPAATPELASVIDRCLRKRPSERFANGSAMLAALNRPAEPASAGWWRTHQLSMMALYLVGLMLLWQIKELVASPVPRWLFVAMGLAAAFVGIVRGHLLFTLHVHPGQLLAQCRRTDAWTAVGDGIIAVSVIGAGLLLAQSRPVFAVLTMALGAGIGIARLLIEPARCAEVFGMKS